MSLFGNLKTKKHFPKGDSAHTRIAGESFSKSKALKKMKGGGAHSKVTFTPKNKSEERKFNKTFRSKTG